MRLLLIPLGLLMAGPAFAQSAQNASDASGATSVAVGAIGESGLKATVGVVAGPMSLAGAASGVAGVAASVAGQPVLADGLSAAAGAASEAADASARFGNEPLTITEDVIIAPQPAPKVPYEPVRPAKTGDTR